MYINYFPASSLSPSLSPSHLYVSFSPLARLLPQTIPQRINGLSAQLRQLITFIVTIDTSLSQTCCNIGLSKYIIYITKISPNTKPNIKLAQCTELERLLVSYPIDQDMNQLKMLIFHLYSLVLGMFRQIVGCNSPRCRCIGLGRSGGSHGMRECYPQLVLVLSSLLLLSEMVWVSGNDVGVRKWCECQEGADWVSKRYGILDGESDSGHPTSDDAVHDAVHDAKSAAHQMVSPFNSFLPSVFTRNARLIWHRERRRKRRREVTIMSDDHCTNCTIQAVANLQLTS